MVKYSEAQLNQTFAALVDPTRRAILARLEREPGLSVSELAAGPMAEATAWLRKYERFWPGSLDRLAAHAERKESTGEGETGMTNVALVRKMFHVPRVEASAWART